MTILFAGSQPYEFVNVNALVTTGATFDPTHVEGSIGKTSFTDRALGRLLKQTTEQELWLHAKILFGSTITSGTENRPVFGFVNSSNVFLGGVQHGIGDIEVTSNTTDTSILDLLTRNLLCDVDIHYFQSGSSRVVELYINGNLLALARSNTAWVIPDAVVMGGFGNSANYFSEIIVTEGNVPTIGMRLHSKKPDPSLPGLNTFESGFWGSLANGNLTDGVVTTNPGARITGGFQPYTGPAEPLGIRGIVQSGRYLKNGTLLNMKGQLRIADVNYDTPDYEYDDGNRVFSVWETNPATDTRFQVSDFPGLQGGFRTTVGS